MPSYILALDQGTTSSRAILFNHIGQPIAARSHEFAQNFPQPGWVEHDPNDIWESQIAAARDVIHNSGIAIQDIAGIGITNQRETTVLWDRRTGEPVANAIVWQCRRTAGLCEGLKEEGVETTIHSRTGLVVDAYFSGTKILWLLDNIPDARVRAERGELAFGTVDSWLIYRLTNGRCHVTDPSNASRTMLYNINDRCWDPELLKILNIPEGILPDIRPSSGVIDECDPVHLGAALPIAGIAGDQQAALFGQGCFSSGRAKNTYGTGCFLLMHTGHQPVYSGGGLLTTVAWSIDDTVEYALEGSVFVGGAVIQWLRDQLGLITQAAESEELATSVEDAGGMYLVPAFVGLGAPYWDMYARGLMVGLTRGTTRGHIIRAALESIAYQTRDVVETMARDASMALESLRVDGGAAGNDFLMQFQADLLGVPVERPAVAESTAQGAAYLAGLGVGFWKDRETLPMHNHDLQLFQPKMDKETRNKLYHGWQKAVQRSQNWAGQNDV
ncbi:MAG: glycerol kinase GlpK [Gemmatimonadota bacterium]|nr:glycerol kinase GlpK [Gemmatimonadota bacterium]